LVNLVPGITPPYTNPNPVLDPQQNRMWETNGLSNAANSEKSGRRRKTMSLSMEAVFSSRHCKAIQPSGRADQQLRMRSPVEQLETILNPITRSGSNGVPRKSVRI